MTDNMLHRSQEIHRQVLEDIELETEGFISPEAAALIEEEMEELEAEMEEIVANTAYGSVDELKKDVDGRRYKESMMAQKVMGMLRENAVVNAG